MIAFIPSPFLTYRPYDHNILLLSTPFTQILYDCTFLVPQLFYPISPYNLDQLHKSYLKNLGNIVEEPNKVLSKQNGPFNLGNNYYEFVKKVLILNMIPSENNISLTNIIMKYIVRKYWGKFLKNVLYLFQFILLWWKQNEFIKQSKELIKITLENDQSVSYCAIR